MTATTRTTTPRLEWIRPEQTEPHPNNPRRDAGDVTELAASIAAIGVLEPIVVAPAPGSVGVYRIIAGHRRVKAAVQAGEDQVPALVRRDLDSDQAQLEAMLVENLQRVDLSPMEEADAYEQLRLEFGLKPAQIAKSTGRSKATVDSRLALRKLPEALQDQVHTHQVSLAEAAVMVEFAGDADVLATLLRYVGNPNQFAGWADHYRTMRARHAEHVKQVKAARAEGARVVPAAELGDHWRWGGGPGPKALTGLAMTTEQAQAHAAGCEHHALVDDGADLVPACMDPTVHGGPAVTSAADEAAREASARDAEERRAAVAKLREELEVATQCRTRFLTDLVRAGKLTAAAQVEMLAEVLRTHLLHEWEADPVHLADLLGLNLPDAADDEDPGDLALRTLVKQADRWTLPRLVQAVYAAALIVERPHQIGQLDQEWGWTSDGGATARGYLGHLQLLGYTPCDIEQQLLARSATPSCRVCGCTEDAPCLQANSEPCLWVHRVGSTGLCSRCAPTESGNQPGDDGAAEEAAQ